MSGRESTITVRWDDHGDWQGEEPDWDYVLRMGGIDANEAIPAPSPLAVPDTPPPYVWHEPPTEDNLRRLEEHAAQAKAMPSAASASEDAPSPPGPLAVPDDVRRLVWEVATALGDTVQSVTWAHGGLHVDCIRHHFDVFSNTATWSLVTRHLADDGHLVAYTQPDVTDAQGEALSALAIEVEQWASGLVAQAVTDGDWTRPEAVK